MMNPETNIRDEFASLVDDWESASRYLSIFIDECQQTLDELTEALLALESGAGQEGVKPLFIAAHRLKGSAASIGLNRPARLAHLMEDLLQILVDNGSEITPEIADGLLACTDGLREYVDAIKAGRPESDRFSDLAQQLPTAESLSEATASSPVASQPEAPSPVPEAAVAEPAAEKTEDTEPKPVGMMGPAGAMKELHKKVAAAIRSNESGNALVGRITFEPTLPLVGLKARLVYEKLSNLGEVRYCNPPAADLESLEEIGALEFGVVTERTVESVRQTVHVGGIQEMTIETLAVKRSATRTSGIAPPGSAEAGVKPAETLRVDIERLDKLMNLAGQLAIGKARVTQIGDKLKTAVEGTDSLHILRRATAELKGIGEKTSDAEDLDTLRTEMDELRGTARRLYDSLETARREAESHAQVRFCVNDLFETIHVLDGVSDGIRQTVMDMRMLPIGPLFNRFHRVVRDITRANGKDIHLTISGEKTELDKRMIDELGDPMIHLIRNAADHGIEPPDVREAAGKPRQGAISLDACHRGSNIVIRVSDDGSGLDPDRIRARAIEKGLISAADAEAMTRKQICQLIWLPGLSTAGKVTDVSGRGVGMDIVRAKIGELNGAVEVESEPGQGTTFTIKLPLTLAVLPSLMVEIEGDIFAIPLESVLEIVHVRQSDMTTVHGQRIVPIRDRVIAVLALRSVLHWRQGGAKANAGAPDETTLVIVGERSRQLGLAVNRVLGEEDIVIKSIADNYHNIAGIAGASILGDGRISLILDPATLIEMSSHPVVVTADK